MDKTSVKPEPNSGFILLFAFGLTIVSFVGSTLFTEQLASRIDRAALGISQNSAPSVQHLATARAELHELSDAAEDYINGLWGHGVPLPLVKLVEAREALDRELESYQLRPALTPHEPLVKELVDLRRRLYQTLDEALVLANQQRYAEALEVVRTRFQPLATEMTRALRRGIADNAAAIRALGDEIERVRTETHRVAYLLDGLSAAIAVVALVLCVRYLRRQSELQEARANELEQFAGRVAHDILGPLSPVRVALDVLQKKVPADLKLGTIIDRAQRSLGNVRHLVDGLLTFARSGAHPDTNARSEVASVLREVTSDAEPLAAERKVSVSLSAPGELAAACSPGVLQSLTQNLVRNAIKYMGESPVREVKIRAARAQGTIRVEVEDTGPGIPPGAELSLFEPYVRGPNADQPGFGLGLATVKRLAEGHGGRAGVQSKLGEGSTFWFEVPATTLEARAEPRSSRA